MNNIKNDLILGMNFLKMKTMIPVFHQWAILLYMNIMHILIKYAQE